MVYTFSEGIAANDSTGTITEAIEVSSNKGNTNGERNVSMEASTIEDSSPVILKK